MTDWTGGYVADIGYTFGYYAELNPLRTRLALTSAGIVAPECGTACELGFGQGLSANLHAAASPTRWYGTDFNPSQAGFAQSLATASGNDARLYDEAFADFCHRADLPDFDYLGLHGIWSWISDDNRREIADFVRRKLKVGGVLYVSYNTFPGWAAFAPMRHLMTEHAEVLGSEGRGIVNRIDGALEFADKLMATTPLFARANPLVGERIKKLREQSRHYLAHEYFNRDWHPMHFATMADWLEPAKVQYACPASLLDHVDALSLTAEQQAFLREIPDPMFRESVRDFMVNQQFRRDCWVKGVRRLPALEQSAALRAQRVVLVSHRPDVPLKAAGALGEASLSEAVYAPILALLADHKVRTVGEIERAVAGKGVNVAQLLQSVAVLTGVGHLAPVQDEATAAKAKPTSDRLNVQLMANAQSSADVGYLASPVTGGGVAVGRFQQLFLVALKQGKKAPAEWARSAWEVLASQGQRIVLEGKPLDGPQENLAELERMAQRFEAKQLPILRALRVA